MVGVEMSIASFIAFFIMFVGVFLGWHTVFAYGNWVGLIFVFLGSLFIVFLSDKNIKVQYYK